MNKEEERSTNGYEIKNYKINQKNKKSTKQIKQKQKKKLQNKIKDKKKKREELLKTNITLNIELMSIV